VTLLPRVSRMPSADVDRYVVALSSGESVRARRGNLVVTEPGVADLVLASIGTKAAAQGVVQRLSTRHGAAMVTRLLSALVALPARGWSVEDDIRLIDDGWCARALPGRSLRSTAAPPATKMRKSETPKSRECREVELRSQLSQRGESTLVREFLDRNPGAAPVREAVVTAQTASEPPLQLAYEKPTRLTVTSKGALPLPYGCMLLHNCPLPDGVGVAAVIPTEWPLRIAPSQFVLRTARGKEIVVPCSYEVNDMRRDTPLAELLSDIRAFLKSVLRPKLAPSAIDALHLHVARREGSAFVPLPANAHASDEGIDLFNLGACFDKGQVELAIVTLPPTPPLHLPAPNPPAPNPPAPNALHDALQQRLRVDRHGAGNTRPLAPMHNTMLNTLCSQGIDHSPTVNLPTDAHTYRSLAAHLTAIEKLPVRCCHNCGMMNYPAAGDTIVVTANGLDDLRAWRVYGGMINRFCSEQHLPIADVFLCAEADPRHGLAQRRVYSCTACKKEVCRDPMRYDLFDGHVSDGADGWRYDGNGVGSPVPDALANLTSEERLALGVVKMADAAFTPAYSNSGYMHFASGGFLQPGDFHGLSTILVQDPSTLRTPEEQRMRCALDYLMDETTGNPLVRQTLTCFERELARNANDAFPAAAGVGALPVMAWDDMALREPGREVTIGQQQPRELNRRGITGALQTVVEPPTDATLRQNAAEHHTVGERLTRMRTTVQQPFIAETPDMSVGNALHPTLYHSGEGAWHQSDTACDEAHFRKLRLASINPKFRAAHEVCH